MKAVVQRVAKAQVDVDGETVASIGPGFLALVGVHKEDTEADVEWIVRKIAHLRVFEDSNGHMNEPIQSIQGEILLVSQFTLIASTRKGNRPSFNDAADPPKGDAYYQKVAAALETAIGRPVQTGVFGAMMEVSLINDGPVTIVFDSRNRE